MTSPEVRLFSQFMVSISAVVLFNLLHLQRVYSDIYRHNQTAEEIEKLLKKHEIIPDVIKTAPKHVLQATYLPTPVKFGNEILANETDLEPSLMEWPAENEYHYTLIMTDPDVPNRTTHFQREWQNWIVVNIPGCQFTKGDVLTEYIPPLPEEVFGGLHRIIFLAYRQPKPDILFSEPHLGEEDASYGLRGNFSTEKFATKYKLGVPVAVNFFYLKWANIV